MQVKWRYNDGFLMDSQHFGKWVIFQGVGSFTAAEPRDDTYLIVKQMAANQKIARIIYK
jgi:hypothetical protein